MDPRNATREVRQKSKWVQELIKEEEETAAQGKILEGRNQGEVYRKSSIPASSALETKTSAGIVQTLKKKEESIHMELELYEKLNEIQKSIADSQTRQTKLLNQTLSLLTDYINHDLKKIVSLESDNRYNKRLSDDIEQLKNKLRTYQFLFWGFVVVIIVSIMFYLWLT